MGDYNENLDGMARNRVGGPVINHSHLAPPSRDEEERRRQKESNVYGWTTQDEQDCFKDGPLKGYNRVPEAWIAHFAKSITCFIRDDEDYDIYRRPTRINEFAREGNGNIYHYQYALVRYNGSGYDIYDQDIPQTMLEYSVKEVLRQEYLKYDEENGRLISIV